MIDWSASGKIKSWSRIQYTMWHDVSHDCCFGNGCWSLYAILTWDFVVSFILWKLQLTKFHQRMSERFWEAVFKLLCLHFLRTSLRIYFLIFRSQKVFPSSCNLVDPASSHMLVSKTQPCKSKYKQFIRRNCRWLIKTVIVSMSVDYYLDIHGNSRANTCVQTRLLRKGCAY